MANNLTGDFEAVLQISVRQLNAILATMHQRRVEPHASPSFEHGGTIQIGESRFSDEISVYQGWAIGALSASSRSLSVSSGNALTTLFSITPPGVSEYLQATTTNLIFALDQPVPVGGGVRGKVDFQVSNPTLSFPTASNSVTIHVQVRATFAPDPGSDALPAPIHGGVDAVYRVTTKRPLTVGGRLLLSVQVSPDDNLIQFTSARTGPKPTDRLLSVADENKISVQIRKVLRKQFAPVDVQLPAGFAFSEFKALGEAVSMPLRLPDSPVPAGNIASLTRNFLGSSEFAIAVSREYVQKFLDQLIERIRQAANAIKFFITISTPLGDLFTVNYQGSFSNPSVVWNNGSIVIGGTIDVISDSDLAPNGRATFTQSIAVVLDVPNQTVSVRPLGDAVIDASGAISEKDARDAIRGPRDNGIAEANAVVSRTFRAALDKLTSAVQTFDINTATVKYAALDLTPDGIVVRGAIGTSGRLDPIVVRKEIGGRWTAFDSWIPGGWITRYKWTWQEQQGGALSWTTTTKRIEDAHGFSIATPKAVANTARICLEIEGTRISPEGIEETVTAGNTCGASWTEPILTAPSWVFNPVIPLWIPPFADGILTDGIVGHLNVVGGVRGPNTLTPNTLVHFAGAQMDRPLEGLSQALSQMQIRDHSVTTILVLPPGALDNRRSEVEAGIGALGERFAANNLLVTEDFQGGWTKTFAAPDGPSTHLINARGEFVWNQMGTLDCDALTAALDAYLLPAPGPRTAPLRLTVQPGDPMPDTVFTDDEGDQTAARRLRGQSVLLTFWKSWSAPCIQELLRLQRLQNHERPPLVLAINGGEDRTVLADVRGRNYLTFPLIHDPLQAIAMQYGVQCWPTTVSINREGIVDRVQFGLTRDDAYAKTAAGA